MSCKLFPSNPSSSLYLKLLLSRIHETYLKNQGMLPLTCNNEVTLTIRLFILLLLLLHQADYKLLKPDDTVAIAGLATFSHGVFGAPFQKLQVLAVPRPTNVCYV